jgi:hypothetical protein
MTTAIIILILLGTLAGLMFVFVKILPMSGLEGGG